jgi:aminoglycoside phosphotransferase (APT) family kinase protein
MTHRWKQDIDMNEVLATALIEKQQLFKIHSINFLDEGWDNVVYRVNNDLIFRFPRREFGIFCMENEIALTPYIQQHVSFPLSAAEWVGKPTKEYPYSYAGYRMLPGNPVCDAMEILIDDERFAIRLASWLRELHGVPVMPEHIAQVKGDHAWRTNVAYRVMRCKENLEQYEAYFLEANFKKELLLEIINDLSQWHFEEVKRSFVHADLYSRHIMVDPKTLLPSGLIDWGDVHIGHPGIDLYAGMIFTKRAFQVFLNTYGSIDDETKQIMLLNSFSGSMSFLPYAFEQNKPALKRWATLVLQRVIEEI